MTVDVERFLALRAHALIDMNPRWVPAVPPALLSAANATASGQRCLRLRLARRAPTLFSSLEPLEACAAAELALLPRARLAGLMLDLGTMAHAEPMRTTIARDRLQLYRQAAGDDRYRLALATRAGGPLQATSLSACATLADVRALLLAQGLCELSAWGEQPALRERWLLASTPSVAREAQRCRAALAADDVEARVVALMSEPKGEEAA